MGVGSAAEGSTEEEGLADARPVPLATLSVPPSGRGQVAAAKDVGQTPVVAASAVEGVLGSQSPAESDGVRAAFFDGYRDAGGQDEGRVAAMIQCESSWRLDQGGYHLGLAQFDPGTWATVSAITGYADWLNPYHQGANVATWASMISPGTSAGWPSCWWAW